MDREQEYRPAFGDFDWRISWRHGWSYNLPTRRRKNENPGGIRLTNSNFDQSKQGIFICVYPITNQIIIAIFQARDLLHIWSCSG